MFAIPFNPSGALTGCFERTCTHVHPSLDGHVAGVAGATLPLFVAPHNGHGIDHGITKISSKAGTIKRESR